MNGRLQNCFMWLLGLSFVLYLAAVAVGAGVNALPWDLPDRHGQVFGFNDPMSLDHLRMALARVTLPRMAKEAGIYGSVLGIMHLVGLWLLRLPMACGRRGAGSFSPCSRRSSLSDGCAASRCHSFSARKSTANSSPTGSMRGYGRRHRGWS